MITAITIQDSSWIDSQFQAIIGHHELLASLCLTHVSSRPMNAWLCHVRHVGVWDGLSQLCLEVIPRPLIQLHLCSSLKQNNSLGCL